MYRWKMENSFHSMEMNIKLLRKKHRRNVQIKIFPFEFVAGIYEGIE